MRAFRVVIWCVTGLIVLASQAEESSRPWSAEMLRDASNFPHAESDSHIVATPVGLRVEVPEGRKYAIAAASNLKLPRDLGRFRVRIAEVGGGGKWFIRVYGELRQSGDRRTAAITQDQEAAGEFVFDVDPRLCSLPDVSRQLQLGVEGEPGAFAVYEAVELLPPLPRANCARAATTQAGQKPIAAVELMPNVPQPLQLLDWRAKAVAYDKFVFDHRARGEFLPLVWWDNSHINIDRTTFGLPSYVGPRDQGPGILNSSEGITCMGAVLGATLVGVDKSRQEADYVTMCEAWFNSRSGLNLVLNRQIDAAGGSFWYELMPHIVFYALADRYPEHERLMEIVRVTADRWQQACLDLKDSSGIPNFEHTSFDFKGRKPVDNGKWKEPDAAAGVAWLEYAAWKKFGQAKHLDAAKGCLEFLQRREDNPYYEMLLPFGALTAARMNAELDTAYDVDRLLNWCFGISDCRGGWGVIVGNWGGYDCDGLAGCIDNRSGYAFAMNTFSQAGALVPLARYDCRYARAIGKWMLNVANASRLFYPGSLPAGHETSGFWQGDPQHLIAYEGLRYEWKGKRPCATGDPLALNWGPKTDLGLYGSSYVGMLGAIVSPTNVPAVLRLDCIATDSFVGESWPTSLCYNPFPSEQRIELPVGPRTADVYDAVSHQFLQRRASGVTAISLPADSARVLVVVPSDAEIETRESRSYANGVILDFHAE